MSASAAKWTQQARLEETNKAVGDMLNTWRELAVWKYLPKRKLTKGFNLDGAHPILVLHTRKQISYTHGHSIMHLWEIIIRSKTRQSKDALIFPFLLRAKPWHFAHKNLGNRYENWTTKDGLLNILKASINGFGLACESKFKQVRSRTRRPHVKYKLRLRSTLQPNSESISKKILEHRPRYCRNA